MEIYWTLKAQDDLERIYRFALQYRRQHADDVLDRLITGCAGLTAHPAIGVQQTRYEPREVRKVLFDDYEVHYELRDNDIYIVDLWHTKEER
ncbi:TPA: type II toxin-antitoxin system RelE/ParE family toxin [Citrobacter freundii]|jgi:plasmid stabilization system protein ParE|uniref:type II toxin-antitoxin system RelE/ParE family toxin n=1 Tax=Enterobacteriaceae TaxID=543 RepID=UPI001646D016|nr:MULTISPECIES: type II toxin-antitoxin system RelE/ParE family toxin [Enterobacteriaceae]ELJ2008381.1 type II toxin-antitoxin system RelE/ParE family toxin [Klebsiella aerogenes]HDR2325307.1 type II toxin-antitoxin system RelE/ParE family toxin [Enterobacter kobei]MBJ7585481.1 type II toxin-antitoxin system RelE/ParE family toxin [Citrobacter freundii]WPA27650.1 type II toxin-antitoxin system RelE/ParE family toxin [Klebsiella quasipneumoniae]HBV7901342.1 type II toxin-antitoxin system RelE/